MFYYLYFNMIPQIDEILIQIDFGGELFNFQHPIDEIFYFYVWVESSGPLFKRKVTCCRIKYNALLL